MKKLILIFFTIFIFLFVPDITNAGQPTAHPATQGSILYTYDTTCAPSQNHRGTHGIIIPEGTNKIDEIYLYFHGWGTTGTLGPTPQDMCTKHELCKNAAILKNQHNKNIAILVPEGVKGPNGNKNFSNDEMNCYLTEVYNQIKGIIPNSPLQERISVVSGHSAGAYEIMKYLDNGFQANKVLVFDGCYGNWCQTITNKNQNSFLYASIKSLDTKAGTEASKANTIKTLTLDISHDDVRVNCFLDHVNSNNCVSSVTPTINAGNNSLPSKELTANNIEDLLQKPQPRIKIPGLQFSDINISTMLQEDSLGTWLHIPYLGEYLSAIYKYAVVVASVLAVIMIIVAGMQWTMSGGNPNTIGSAQKRIGGALIGLILVVGSYTILYTVNPNLVEFKNLKILYVKSIPLPEIDVIEENVTTLSVTKDANNVPDFKQFDAAWGNKVFGNIPQVCEKGDPERNKESKKCCTPISASGCGPTSLAMVLSSFLENGQQIKPDSVAAFIGQSPEYGRKCNTGTGIGTALTKLNQSPWSNFTSKQVKKDEALKLLNQGKPLIFLCIKCSGYDKSRKLKSYGGHYMVLKSINADAEIEVNDPGCNNNCAIKTMTTSQLDKNGGFWYVYPKQ